ncbi:MAG TPA: ABC transporter permease, partial [Blastocatellia bacterium]|nr:ABC transporter permease [Blastocatellia bacterium]
MNTLVKDLRYGLRVLARNPGFTAVAVLMLGLGIGANSAIFSIVNAMLIKPLPYSEPDRIVWVYETAFRQGFDEISTSFPDFVDWRDQNQVFEHMAAYGERSFNVSDGDEPERVEGAVISAALFSVLGVQPALGRAFLAEEDRPDADAVVILTHGLWQRRFGADPGVIGRALTVDGKSHTVVGVMPPNFNFPDLSDMYVPLGYDVNKSKRGDHHLAVIARLKPEASLAQARAEMAAIAGRLEQQYPETNAGVGAAVVAYQERLSQGARPIVMILLGAVSFVLLMACANVANLLLARAAGREKEISIRLAIGASRVRLIRQLLTESVLLGIFGGALGLAIALAGVRVILSMIPVAMPFWMKIEIDPVVVAYTFAAGIITGVVFGLAPAFQSTRLNLNESLTEGGKGSSAGGRSRVRNLFAVSEIALAVVLLIGAGLMVKSFRALQSADPGFDARNLLTLQLSLPRAKYSGADEWVGFQHQLIERVRGLGGVRTAALVSNLPIGGSNWGKSFSVEGHPEPESGLLPVASYRVVGPGYFSTLGTALVGGREFNEQDAKDSLRVAIVNEMMARQYWPGEDPVGKRIKTGRADSDSPWLVVAGVVADARQNDIDAPIKPEIYT